MKRFLIAFAGMILLSTSAAWAQVGSVSHPFVITVTINPSIAAVDLSGTVVNTSGPANAGQPVGDVQVTTNPPTSNLAGVSLSLGGADGLNGNFVLSSPTPPAKLTVNPNNNLQAGRYQVTVTAAAGPSIVALTRPHPKRRQRRPQ